MDGHFWEEDGGANRFSRERYVEPCKMGMANELQPALPRPTCKIGGMETAKPGNGPGGQHCGAIAVNVTAAKRQDIVKQGTLRLLALTGQDSQFFGTVELLTAFDAGESLRGGGFVFRRDPPLPSRRSGPHAALHRPRSADQTCACLERSASSQRSVVPIVCPGVFYALL